MEAGITAFIKAILIIQNQFNIFYPEYGNIRLFGLLFIMVRYAVLGSGSCGNSYIFQNENGSILVDAGYSCREIIRRMEACGFTSDCLNGIFITHTHSDHFRGVEVLARKLSVPVYLHGKLDRQSLFTNPPEKIISISGTDPVEIAGFRLYPFKTNHDSPHSISFSVVHDELSFSIITDTGKTDDKMLAAAADSDILFLEANYDPEMLRKGPYHYNLKKRIASARGHLSNDDAVRFVNDIHLTENSKLKKVYFCHLSGTNNHPDLLERRLKEHLLWPGEWTVCRKGEPVNDHGQD